MRGCVYVGIVFVSGDGFGPPNPFHDPQPTHPGLVSHSQIADEILEKLQEVAEEFDAAMDTTPEPSALEK